MASSSTEKISKILVVDDDKNILNAIKRLFYDYDNYQLSFAENGYEALEIIQNLHPDLVTLDINMPGIDGIEVCKRIKTNEETNKSMVLLLSAKSTLEDKLMGYNAIADDYLTKPFNPPELIAKIKILLRLKKAQDELLDINQNQEEIIQEKTRELVRKERQAMIGDMVQGLVHNLRGPLTGASGLIEMAKLELEDLTNTLILNEQQEKLLQTIYTDINYSLAAYEQLKEMISSLLLKRRHDEDNKKQAIQLNELIATELNYLNANLFMKHKVKKILNFAPNLPTIDGVYVDFSQICSNILQNSMDAMRESSIKELTIKTWFDETFIYITFQDCGPGIDSNIIEQIFDPFFTTKPSADQAKQDEPSGTGLGLYTCAEIIKRYKGTINCTSLASEGCLFSIKFPR